MEAFLCSFCFQSGLLPSNLYALIIFRGGTTFRAIEESGSETRSSFSAVSCHTGGRMGGSASINTSSSLFGAFGSFPDQRVMFSIRGLNDGSLT